MKLKTTVAAGALLALSALPFAANAEEVALPANRSAEGITLSQCQDFRAHAIDRNREIQNLEGQIRERNNKIVQIVGIDNMFGLSTGEYLIYAYNKAALSPEIMNQVNPLMREIEAIMTQITQLLLQSNNTYQRCINLTIEAIKGLK